MATKLSSILTDIYTNDKLTVPQYAPLSGVFIATAIADIAAADNDGDIIKLFEVPGNAIPVAAGFRHSAITGAANYKFGLYEVGENGAVKDDDALFIVSAPTSATTTAFRNLPASTTSFVTNEQFYILAGDTQYTGQNYVVALTLGTAGTVDGTLEVNLFCKFTGN